jgi:hypothetical protein
VKDPASNTVSFTDLVECTSSAWAGQGVYKRFYDQGGNYFKLKVLGEQCTNVYPRVVHEKIANPSYIFRKTQFLPEDGPNLIEEPFFNRWAQFSSFHQTKITLDGEDYPVEMKDKIDPIHVFFYYLQ